VALLAMAALAFVLADAIEGRGFIAAWLANLGVSVSFVLFGALFLAPVLAAVSWSVVAYALGA
jgi:sodium/hydrogen antiporter